MAQTETVPAKDIPLKQRGRPKKDYSQQKPPDRVPRVLTFFEQVQRIPKEDWGTRASMKLYRLEPVIDRLRTSDNKYICVYAEPGVNEERIKQDHGSGKYRLYLNYKLPTTAEGKEIDSLEFDILDHAFPPNIAAGEWLDAPHNRKWQWAKEALDKREKDKAAAAAAAIPPKPHGAAEVLETIRAVKEVLPQAPPAPTNTAADTLNTIRAVRELFPPPAPQTENHVLTTIVTLMTTQIQAAQQESKELRQELRDIRDKNLQQPQNGVSVLKEIVGVVKEVAPTFREMFPNAGEKVGEIVSGRSRMTSWQEFFQPLAQIAVQTLAPAVPGLMAQMFTPKTNGIHPPGMNGAQPNPGQPAAPSAALPLPPNQKSLIGFMNAISPAMLNYLKKYNAGDSEYDGEMFCDQVMEMYGPTTVEGVNWLQEARTIGAMQIITLYRQSPYWPTIAPMEAKFFEFVGQFLAWTPEENGDSEPEDGVIDLSKDEVETGTYA